jgi:F0F1-type ATP synthase beta subunit
VHRSEADCALTVKFDTDQLPEILNALETDNGGNKLTLEVSVRASGMTTEKPILNHLSSNIWVRVSCDVLLWMVAIFLS